MHSDKAELRLAEAITEEGALTRDGERRLTAAVDHARKVARDQNCDDILPFATSAVRDATNSKDVLERVKSKTGVDLQVLSGADEARLTFLAVRRWYGWSAGRLLAMDIGGGSFEIGLGLDEDPTLAISVPLGAGRLTREWITSEPPLRREVDKLRDYVEGVLDEVVPNLLAGGTPDHISATSKTFRSLARLTGAAPSSAGPRVYRALTLSGLRQVIKFISRMASEDIATLEGVSPTRAHQLLAGAIVAEAAMRQLDCESLEICPWALREGVILRRLDWLEGL